MRFLIYSCLLTILVAIYPQTPAGASETASKTVGPCTIDVCPREDDQKLLDVKLKSLSPLHDVTLTVMGRPKLPQGTQSLPVELDESGTFEIPIRTTECATVQKLGVNFYGYTNDSNQKKGVHVAFFLVDGKLKNALSKVEKERYLKIPGVMPSSPLDLPNPFAKTNQSQGPTAAPAPSPVPAPISIGKVGAPSAPAPIARIKTRGTTGGGGRRPVPVLSGGGGGGKKGKGRRGPALAPSRSRNNRTPIIFDFSSRRRPQNQTTGSTEVKNNNSRIALRAYIESNSNPMIPTVRIIAHANEQFSNVKFKQYASPDLVSHSNLNVSISLNQNQDTGINIHPKLKESIHQISIVVEAIDSQNQTVSSKLIFYLVKGSMKEQLTGTERSYWESLR